MKLISRTDMYKRSNNELSRLQEEVRRKLGDLEREKRRVQATQADIRTVQGQRKIMRPNL
jgi:hypothetical protein